MHTCVKQKGYNGIVDNYEKFLQRISLDNE